MRCTWYLVAGAGVNSRGLSDAVQVIMTFVIDSKTLLLHRPSHHGPGCVDQLMSDLSFHGIPTFLFVLFIVSLLDKKGVLRP